MKIKLRAPLVYCDRTYTELELNLDRLTGKDLLAVSGELRKAGVRDVLSPETDERYLLAVAARAAGVDQELLELLPAREFLRVKLEVQGFLLGSDLGGTPSES